MQQGVNKNVYCSSGGEDIYSEYSEFTLLYIALVGTVYTQMCALKYTEHVWS